MLPAREEHRVMSAEPTDEKSFAEIASSS
jgi:hypothetical protein